MRIRLFGQYVNSSILVLAVAESVILFLVLVAAALLRYHADLSAAERYVGSLWPRGVLFSAAMLVSLMAFGLYSARQRAQSAGIFVRAIAAVAAGIVVTSVCFYVIPDLWIGRGVLVLAAVGALGAVSVSRTMFAHFAAAVGFKRRVLVYGAGKSAESVAQLRRRADQRGFMPVGFVVPEGETSTLSPERLLPSKGELLGLCELHNVDEVVVAMDDRRRAFPVRALLECRLAGIDVTELPSFLERETGRVRIDILNPSWLIFGAGFRRSSLRLFTARILDLVASSLIFMVSVPFMLATIIAIKFEEGWRAPVLYRQERVGLAGREFRLLKFRSMRIDAESDGARWAQKNDPRVTRVGAIIRKLRIDELPQIINVLRGHMSFVGPRPERPEFVTQLSEKIPYYVERHSVKPGITGWAQLCYPYGASEHDAIEKLQYDLYYIKNNSFLFDMAILMQTVEVVFLGKGAR